MTMIWHEEYRGYQVSYQSGDHSAWIKPTESSIPLLERPLAEPGEGRVELRLKAHDIIDTAIRTKAQGLSSPISECGDAGGRSGIIAIE